MGRQDLARRRPMHRRAVKWAFVRRAWPSLESAESAAHAGRLQQPQAALPVQLAQQRCGQCLQHSTEQTWKWPGSLPQARRRLRTSRRMRTDGHRASSEVGG